VLATNSQHGLSAHICKLTLELRTAVAEESHRHGNLASSVAERNIHICHLVAVL
jgi:hypothetical protein